MTSRASAARPGLDPEERSTLAEILRPPDGFELATALGTAFSLDLPTLVCVPLFASGLAAAKDSYGPLDIVSLYELGPRVVLLVQGDRIKPPSGALPSILTLVGDCVVPCAVPDGSFHPKLMVLEFRHRESVRSFYRVVVSSRNLTVDDSWDTVLVFDQAEKGGEPLRGIGEVLKGLSEFVVGARSQQVAVLCDQLATALARVRFQAVSPFGAMAIHLLTPGDPAQSTLLLDQLRGDDLLVVSPFTTKSRLVQLAGQITGERHLVTRPIGVDRDLFDTYEISQLIEGVSASAPEDRAALRGLHAKVYVASSKTGNTVVVTSANATHAGWSRNVEVAVVGKTTSAAFDVRRLVAPSPDAPVGLREPRHPTFGDLLVQLTPDAVEDVSADDSAALDAARGAFAGAVVTATVTRSGDGTRSIDVRAVLPDALPDHVTAQVRPYDVGVLSDLFVDHTDPRHLRAVVTVVSVTTVINRWWELRMTHQPDDAPAVSLDLALLVDLAGDLDLDVRKKARHQLLVERSYLVLEDLAARLGVPAMIGSRARPDGEKDPGNPGHLVKDGQMVAPALRWPLLERLALTACRPASAAGVVDLDTIDALIRALPDGPEFDEVREVWALLHA